MACCSMVCTHAGGPCVAGNNMRHRRRDPTKNQTMTAACAVERPRDTNTMVGWIKSKKCKKDSDDMNLSIAKALTEKQTTKKVAISTIQIITMARPKPNTIPLTMFLIHVLTFVVIVIE